MTRSSTGRIRGSISHACWRNRRSDAEVATRCIQGQDHGLEKQLDNQLIKLAAPALERKEAVKIEMPIRNSNRTFATMLSGQIAMLHGREGLPKGTIDITLTGIAGQSFGAFLAPGIDLRLIGEANDYVGKGMAGGRIIIRPDARAGLRLATRTRSSATPSSTAPPAAKPISPARQGSVSACVTPGSPPWLKGSAIMAANT